jgi:ketosteroid isomerase-like protein
MSQENVEAVRAWFDTWNVTGELDLSPFDPELIYHPRTDEPDPSPHVGRDAYEQLARGFIESFSEIKYDVLEVRGEGDYVIASTVLRCRVRDSGITVGDAYVFVNKMREGIVVEGWEYQTMEEALEAVRLLSEQDARAGS